LARAIEETADVFAFLMQQLGMAPQFSDAASGVTSTAAGVTFSLNESLLPPKWISLSS
jgi:hypothetical protein